jgi:DNA-directed RNA polymerase alpha subunit
MENPFDQLDKRLASIEIAIIQIQHILGLSKLHQVSDEIGQKSIRVLKLSRRAYNLLNISKIYTVNELSKWSKEDLLYIRGMGQSSMKEIEDALLEIGIKLSHN